MFGRKAFCATLISFAAAGPALPSDPQPWYPRECVAIDFCAVVESVAWVVPHNANTPRPMISSVHGRAVVPKNFLTGPSGDGRIHVCLRYDPFGSLEVTCLLVPSRLF